MNKDWPVQGTGTRANELAVEVSNLTNNDDLDMIIEAMKVARSNIESLIGLTFVVGDEVTFKHKNMTRHGRVRKINPKNIIVDDDSGDAWNIWPSLLKHHKVIMDGSATISNDGIKGYAWRHIYGDVK